MKRRSPSVRLFLIVLLIIVAAAGLWVFGMLHHTCPYGEPCDPATKGWLWTTPVSVTGLVLGGGLTVVGMWLRRRP